MNRRTAMAEAISAPSARRSTSRALAAFGAGAAAIALLAGCAGAGAPGETATPSAEPTVTAAATTQAPAEPTADPTNATVAPTETAAAATPTADPTSGKDGVSVGIVAADVTADGIRVRSIVTGYIGEGTCTATLTGPAGQQITATSQAMPDAQTTVCPAMTLAGATPGAWQLVVRFENDERAGDSAPQTVEVR